MKCSRGFFVTEAWFCWLNRSFKSRTLDPNCNTAHRLVVTLITKAMVPYHPSIVTLIHLPEDRTSFDLQLMLFVYWNRREIKFILSYLILSFPAETQLSHTVWRISLGDCRENIQTCHDDVIKWKHFSRYCPFVRGIHRSPVNSPHKGQWRGSLMFSLIYAWINNWVNNREAGNVRRYRARYDVTVIS